MPWSPNAVVKINGVAKTSYTIEGATVSMGREDIQQQSNSGLARIQFFDIPYNDIEIFDLIELTIQNYSGVATTIFKGTVSDVQVSVFNSEGSNITYLTTVLASGALSELATKLANVVGYAEQKDGDRIVSVVTDTFALKWNEIASSIIWTSYTTETWDDMLGVDITNIDVPGTYTLYATTAIPEPENALSYVQTVADSGNGYLYETPNGKIGYQDQDRRVDYVTANGFINIDKSFILADGINVTTSKADIINDATVTYDPTQLTVQTEELTSIDLYGRVTSTLTTYLKNQADAQTLADRFVLLNAYPNPIIKNIGIQIDAPTMSSTLLNNLVNVFFGMPISVTNFPALLYPNQWFGFVEGWTWTISRFQARLDLNVSDFTFSAIPVAWQDVYVGEIWSTIDPALDWQNALLGVN